MNKKVILTGDRPTGPLHLGHYIGSLQNRVKLQHTYDQYVMIANIQGLTDNANNPQKIKDNIIEVALDYLAVGIDPKVSTIFIQSMIPGLMELTVYFLNLVTVSRLQRNPTVKNEIKEKSFKGDIPAGFLVYPVSQAADIAAFKTDLVPVGNDQVPMIEQTNEVVRRFNKYYNSNALIGCKELLSEYPRLPGTDGNGKMGKSTGNAIFLSDDKDTLVKKIRSMYTDPNHLRVEDPGKVEGNPVFTYLRAFDPDQKKVAELEEHYTRGGLGDVKVKNRLTEVLIHVLEPIQQKRKELATDPEYVMKILKDGSAKANIIVEKTLKDVREAMFLNY